MKKYYIVIGVSLLIFTLSELFRPWMYVNNVTSAKRPAGYYLIGRKPLVKSQEEMQNLFQINDNYEYAYSVKLDFIRMLLQRAIIIGLLVFSLLYFKRHHAVIRYLLFISAIIIFCLLYLYVDIWRL